MKYIITTLLLFLSISCIHTDKKAKQLDLSKTQFKCIKSKRVGITSNIKRRHKEWKIRHPCLHNWKKVECGLTYEEAQQKENSYPKPPWHRSGGGKRKTGPVYCVYTFNFCKCTPRENECNT